MTFTPGQSGNPDGRPKGARNKKTSLIKALEEHFGGKDQAESEKGFWALVVKHASKGDTSCIGLIAQRLVPPHKPQSPLLDIDLPAEPVAAAQRLIEAASTGEATVEQAKVLLSGLSDLLRAKEFEEIEQRLASLESQVSDN
ncbi:MAG: DUF5681 domain-containing protein [Candidatus Thiodiazotropha taylori]|uniref:DUF5681 domain-containing protein n=1 Tax=Candidatus Thiodiazotropha taylori TaxID=2792791 RepID=A0A9E4U3D1_9GAMM|nr:DUF5681 domain-containing protein [Candidatus Thiodiazotropha taylori]MCG8096094.1 DUF5681 domain-containing protein [Candidatus Thiodiazotropha endolucinida]RLW53902.1 MAG: hypothetical protein B6D76_09420 [gamma proteobacterium symbiont of Stewartia floridana]MCG8026407.1 DUF5681 domain-containing protein [Candidatus Thiodiazotropha taylori]MCG8106628.1 DUF5681 domain-containing protein [Candidatus Thiodiazotropha taylori]